MPTFALIVLMHFSITVFSQSIKQKLTVAVQKLKADSQLKYGVVGLHIIDSKTGNVLFNENAEIGLAPASCLKIITSVTAFEILGKDYTYKTYIGYDGKIENSVLNGNIVIKGRGDPTLGSWRYKQTAEDSILSRFKKAIQRQKIEKINGVVYGDDRLWHDESIPAGWIWQDIGSYYGAGARALNWRENQYDVILRSAKKIGDPVVMVQTIPAHIEGLSLNIEIRSAEKGSGDKAYIYLPYDQAEGSVRGTIPINEKRFVISGSMPKPARQMAFTLYGQLTHDTIKKIDSTYNLAGRKSDSSKIFYTYTSPSLDSINYWFLKKSVNLYGEALLKTIAFEKTKHGSTDTGVNIIKDFWSKKGIDKRALNLIDGSGLSPANRITASSLTTVLQYARKQVWFSSFYNALPVINRIKMKSGSIGGVTSYAGYVKSGNGTEYTFAFIINNYNGSGSAIKEKMWKLLDLLK